MCRRAVGVASSTPRELGPAPSHRRKDNIKQRKDAKIKKKIEKREKKLMRPGFEGRRDVPINKAAGPAAAKS